MASFLPPLGCWPGQRRKTLLKDQAGILVTEGLKVAIARCRDKVKRLGDECRQRKRKYRHVVYRHASDKHP